MSTKNRCQQRIAIAWNNNDSLEPKQLWESDNADDDYENGNDSDHYDNNDCVESDDNDNGKEKDDDDADSRR